MAIAERIRFFRNLKGMTQKFLGMQVGFSENTADIRLAQYETGKRTPKDKLIEELANVFGISTMAIDIPVIESYFGLVHTLFALEDIYGLKIDKINDETCIRLDKNRGSEYVTLWEHFNKWQKQAEKFRNGEISKEEYDKWRYNYPESDVHHII